METSLENSFQKCVANGKKQKLILEEDSIIERRVSSVRNIKVSL